MHNIKSLKKFLSQKRSKNPHNPQRVIKINLFYIKDGDKIEIEIKEEPKDIKKVEEI